MLGFLKIETTQILRDHVSILLHQKLPPFTWCAFGIVQTKKLYAELEASSKEADHPTGPTWTSPGLPLPSSPRGSHLAKREEPITLRSPLGLLYIVSLLLVRDVIT